MTVRSKDVVPGARLVTGRRLHHSLARIGRPDERFEVVVVQQDEQGLHFVTANGTRRAIERSVDPYASSPLRIPHEVVWTVPVPAATDDELRMLATGAALYATRRDSEKPWLLHVQSVVDGKGIALPVMPKADDVRRGALSFTDDDAPDYVVGNVAIWSHMVRFETGDRYLRAGTLVAMWPDEARIEDGLPVHRAAEIVEVMACSVERLGAWMPTSMGHESYFTAPFAGIRSIVEAEEHAWLRTQPDEALFLGYRDGDEKGAIPLGRSGMALHYSDDIVLDVFGTDDARPGLWLATDARWTGSDDSVEIASDIVPATMEDLARFGLDEDSLRSEIAGHMGVDASDVLDDICVNAIAQARETDEMDRWQEAVDASWRSVRDRFWSSSPRCTHATRLILERFADAARGRGLWADGVEFGVQDEEASLSWPEASVRVSTDGGVEITTPSEVRRSDPARHDDMADVFRPLLKWLETRPEQSMRKRPDDPRTVLLLRT